MTINSLRLENNESPLQRPVAQSLPYLFSSSRWWMILSSSCRPSYPRLYCGSNTNWNSSKDSYRNRESRPRRVVTPTVYNNENIFQRLTWSSGISLTPSVESVCNALLGRGGGWSGDLSSASWLAASLRRRCVSVLVGSSLLQSTKNRMTDLQSASMQTTVLYSRTEYQNASRQRTLF